MPPFLSSPQTWGALALVVAVAHMPLTALAAPQVGGPPTRLASGSHRVEIKLPPGRPHQAYFDTTAAFHEAVEDTQASFSAWGFPLGQADFATRLEVHEKPATLRAAIAAQQGTTSVRIPEGTEAMISLGTFFFIEEDAYLRLGALQHPGKPVALNAHHQLLVRELTHRALGLVAKQLQGNEGAVGPNWFTQGLAYAVAEAHDPTHLKVGPEEAQAWWAQEKAGHPLSGPQRGALVRHLLTWKSAKACFTEATQADFPKP